MTTTLIVAFAIIGFIRAIISFPNKKNDSDTFITSVIMFLVSFAYILSQLYLKTLTYQN